MVVAGNQGTRWTFVLDEAMRILVVDDDPILREFASVHLTTPSATIDTVADGEAAMRELRARAYDLVLLDIEMPGIDGISLLANIRSDPALHHLPVIMLTAHDDIASIDRSYQVGANSFATKPVNWRQLSYHIRYVLRASRIESIGAQETADTGDVDTFLQSVVRRADALAERLSASGLAQDFQFIRNLRLFAEQALAAHAAQAQGQSTASGMAHASTRSGGDAPGRAPSMTEGGSLDLAS
jgi:DNA-binding response OmpR family regulator